METIRIEKQLVRKILMSFQDMSKVIEEKRDRSLVESGFYDVFLLYKRTMIETNRQTKEDVTLVVPDELFDDLFQQATLLVREIEATKDKAVIQEVFCHCYYEYLKYINMIVP